MRGTPIEDREIGRGRFPQLGVAGRGGGGRNVASGETRAVEHYLGETETSAGPRRVVKDFYRFQEGSLWHRLEAVRNGRGRTTNSACRMFGNIPAANTTLGDTEENILRRNED